MALYAISIRQARDLPPPFFRFCLTTDTLGLGYILPAAGRIRDFHPLERALTGRTAKIPRASSDKEKPGDFLYRTHKTAEVIRVSCGPAAVHLQTIYL